MGQENQKQGQENQKRLSADLNISKQREQVQLSDTASGFVLAHATLRLLLVICRLNKSQDKKL